MRDVLGLVPPEIRARIAREEYVDRQAGAGRALKAALRSMDPLLGLVFVKPVAEEMLPPGAIPGRWHVKRDNPPPAVPTYIPITTPDGGYREPSERILMELADRDLTNPKVLERILDQGRDQRQKELEKEQRLDEIRADFKTAKRLTEGALENSYASRRKDARRNR